MKNLFNIYSFSERLSGPFQFPLTRIYFLRAIALLLLFNYGLFWVWHADDYWGTRRLLLPYYNTSYPIFFPFNLLEVITADWLWKGFLFSIFPLCCLAFFRPLNWYLWAAIYWVHANLFHGTAALQNAGSNTLLMAMLLCLLMVPLPFFAKSGPWFWLRNSLSHLGFAMIIFQVLLLYLVASIAKLGGVKWLDGSAFYYVLMNDIYSHPWFRAVFSQNDFVVRFVSWFTLVFQFLFPVLVWFRKTKLAFLFTGVVFHLMIIVVMGIEDFGLIMLVLYIPFLGESRLLALNNRIRKSKFFRHTLSD